MGYTFCNKHESHISSNATSSQFLEPNASALHPFSLAWGWSGAPMDNFRKLTCNGWSKITSHRATEVKESDGERRVNTLRSVLGV